MTQKKGFFRKLFSYTLVIINLLAIVWLVLCYVASANSPDKINHLALFSLTTPFAILLNLLFVILWLFSQRRWRSFISIVALAMSYKLIITVFAFHFFQENKLDKTENSLKVMTWNVHGLGIYDKPIDKKTPQKMFDIIDQENPDILCLPEFYTDWDNAMKPYSDKLLKKGGFKEYRFIYDNTLGTKIFVGTAFYSKYPLSNLKEIVLSNAIKMMQCDVELPGKKMMRTYFIHLQSYLLKDNEKRLIEDMKNRDREVEVEQSKSILKKLSIAIKKRAKQADSAALVMAGSPYPVLVCGDLNDVPASYTYNTIKGGLKDAFCEKGHGIGRTYNTISPTLRIDYIFFDPQLLKIIGYKRLRTSLSDHNPVIANFEIQ